MHLQKLVVSVFLVLSTSALASDPMGVVALPSAVTLEPDVATATTVKIVGTFVRWNATTGQYGAVEAGYTFYSCAAGKEAQCRTEWSEVKAAATNSACI